MATAPSPPPPSHLLRPADDPEGGRTSTLPLAAAAEDTAELLSREEVLRRRSRRVKQLARHYRAHYWEFMEEVRSKIREYYFRFGVSPHDVDALDAAAPAALAEGSGENDGGVVKKVFCGYSGCSSLAMPLSRYCFPHILCDNRQTLYKPCTFQTCRMHVQKTKKHLSESISRAGFKLYSSGCPPPNFHAIVAQCIHQIQISRRKSLNATSVKNTIMQENSDR
ncbi:hypothetical protein Cni_G05311 [Canna indica]|uniref:KAT8 regulatory NSL complex subunit 2 n=1 Tax=Canna indica TaxID=4628 RepID=A0AAQ3JUI8_9LILI|nr:hypothetical protein Cni_G05311 [Canna indica]